MIGTTGALALTLSAGTALAEAFYGRCLAGDKRPNLFLDRSRILHDFRRVAGYRLIVHGLLVRLTLQNITAVILVL